jgi:hypothetical protein
MALQAESLEAEVRVEERVEAELGVDAVVVAAGRSLSIDSEGLVGRCRAGAVEGRS